MSKLRPNRLLTVLALALALVALPLSARVICEWEITVYASGGQTCDEVCHFFSNSGVYQGFIRYSCPV